ncbi:hydroxymethylglutaryl-CoA lyase [Ancylobacter sp. WKF20]|uniref:hydroxymethylglutaryl-CoA lyase n=1 Tax=Ancylobacter sp. WKF20 TaxID=3039801 RepID=UPI00243416F1|nr:hydroxymethylglutaryl-CoA lyase [Ancylobacter sp. WKF20]WGD29660.1 hydroxymethylglutaryl-CoA lyase [Ancylobacter sp. WKF20]
MMDRVTLCEVAPRDGFQPVRTFIPTESKIETVKRLAASGLDRIEIGAFVSPKAIPQMADIREVWAATRDQDTFRPSVLVPNAKGAELALEQGLKEIVFVLSVSESHNRSNVARSVAESMGELRALIERLDEVQGGFLRVNLATCFDCPFEGTIARERVTALVAAISPLRAQIEYGICDTTGRANPAQVAALFAALVPVVGAAGQDLAFHGHDTFGLGVANALYAYQAGVRIFDAAAGGLGGCPFAPGASGNTATEDLIFAFENMGIATGVNLNALLDAAGYVASLDPPSSGGHLTRVPRGRALGPAHKSPTEIVDCSAG